LLASLRDMDGQLISRQPIAFDSGQVINYAPVIDGRDSFEGSVEIEAFSATDLKIPFTAISAIYEAGRSASLVHAYGRVYSSHEIEDGRTVPTGREAGWTLRDTEEVRSFAVLHNGMSRQSEQTAVLQVRNHGGKVLKVEQSRNPRSNCGAETCQCSKAGWDDAGATSRSESITRKRRKNRGRIGFRRLFAPQTLNPLLSAFSYRLPGWERS